jgi:hypothetical protein
MTTGAWVMLIVTWSIVSYFTFKFFWMVLKKPPQS